MNKKRIVIIGAAVLFLIAVSAAALVIHRNSVEQMEMDTQVQSDKDRIGIDYGGGFDEFDYDPEDNSETDGDDWDESQSDYENAVNMTSDELKDELSRRREENGFGRKNVGAAEINVQSDEDNTDYDDFIEDDFEETDGAVDISELGIVTIESKGYSQNEVLYNAESQEDAESVAAQISGKLLSWENGVAAIQIDGSVDELLEDLERQGSSLYLYRNYYYY